MTHSIKCLSAALGLCLIALSSPLHASDDARAAAEKIAANSGIENWDSISHLVFTFTAEVPAMNKSISRSWDWSPKSGKIRQIDTGYTYNQNELKEADKETDAKFVNDAFWLLFPFNLVWTEGLEFTLAEGPVESPIAQTPLSMLTVQFPDDGGYTPGDAYDVYFDADYRIQEWAYRKGGQAEPNLVCTWQDYQEFGGVVISTDHQGPGGFRLQIKDIHIH